MRALRLIGRSRGEGGAAGSRGVGRAELIRPDRDVADRAGSSDRADLQRLLGRVA